jgi:hypothetical protein
MYWNVSYRHDDDSRSRFIAADAMVRCSFSLRASNTVSPVKTAANATIAMGGGTIAAR